MLTKLNKAFNLNVRFESAKAPLQSGVTFNLTEIEIKQFIQAAVTAQLNSIRFPCEVFIDDEPQNLPASELPPNKTRIYLSAHIASTNNSLGYIELTFNNQVDLGQGKIITDIQYSNSVVEYCLTRAQRTTLGEEDISLANAEEILRSKLAVFVSEEQTLITLKNAIQTVWDECQALSRNNEGNPKLFITILSAVTELLEDPYQEKESTQKAFKNLVQSQDKFKKIALGSALLMLIGIAILACSFMLLGSHWALLPLFAGLISFVTGLALFHHSAGTSKNNVSPTIDAASALLPPPQSFSFWSFFNKAGETPVSNQNELGLSGNNLRPAEQ